MKKIVDIYLRDNKGIEFRIGTAKIDVDTICATIISDKEKIITLDKLNLDFKDGDELYNNGGYWLNTFKNNMLKWN